MAWARPLALCACSKLDLALLSLSAPLVLLSRLLPQPFDDRLAELGEVPERLQPLGPLQRNEQREKWTLVRAAEIDRTVRALLAPPYWVLDVGHGDCLLADSLAQHENYVVEALDVVGTEEPQGQRLGKVRLTRGSLERIPFEDEMFDVIILSNVLELSSNIPGALLEASRMLRPGGIFFCDTVERSLASFLGVGGSSDWRFFISPQELQHGLREVEIANFTHQAWRRSWSGSWRLEEGGSAWSPLLDVHYLALARRERPAYYQYTVNEPVGVLRADPLKEEMLSLCRVLSVGFEPDTWDLECCEGDEERPTNVPAEHIHRWPVYQNGTMNRVWHNSTWRDCRVLGWGSRTCTYDVALVDTGQALPGVWHGDLQTAAEYRPGDAAELKVEEEVPKAGAKSNSSNITKWIRCTVLGANEARGTYDIRIPTPNGPKPFKDVPRIASSFLRPRREAAP